MAAATYLYLLWDTSYGGDPDGWTYSSSFQNRYILAHDSATSPPTTGGDTNHIHTSSGTAVAGDGGATIVRTGGTNSASQTHTHAIIRSPTVGNSSNVPLNYSFKILYIDAGTKTMPQNMIAFFESAPATGFSAYSLADGRYLIGVASEIIESSAGGATNHTHSISDTTGNNSTFLGCTTGTTNIASSTHNHPFNVTSANGVWAPPGVKLLLYRATSNITMPSGLIAMFDGDPPADWTLLSDGATYLHKLLYADTTTGTTGAAHSHSFSAQTSGPSATLGAGGGFPSGNRGSSTHTHTISGTLVSADPLPAYVEMVLAKFKGVPTGTDLSLNLRTRTPRIIRKHLRNKIR